MCVRNDWPGENWAIYVVSASQRARCRQYKAFAAHHILLN